MNRERKLPFDPKALLSKVNAGRAISDYRKDQNVYTQGERADSVFYIQSGKVKKTVVSEQGKEAVVALLGIGDCTMIVCRKWLPIWSATTSPLSQRPRKAVSVTYRTGLGIPIGCRRQLCWNSVTRSPAFREYPVRQRGQLADRWALLPACASHRPCAC
jgi:hypothetical protein